MSSGALLIFDLEDQFARDRAVKGPHPRPIGSVRFFLVNQTGNPQPFDPPREMVVSANPTGYLLFFGNIILPDGAVRRVDPTQWPWTIRVESDFYQKAEQTPPAAPPPASFVPGAPGSAASDLIHFDLAPGPSYPFPNDPPGQGVIRLRGAQRNTDGTAVAGMPVQALDSATKKALGNSAITGADGQWIVTFPPPPPSTGVVIVRFTKPDGTFDDVTGVQVKPDIDNNLAQTALRGQVRVGKVGLPGAVVTVAGVAGQTITDSSGNWFYYFGPNQAAASVTLNVALPDGQKSSRSKVQVQPRATVVVPSFDF